jgi:hypothetical protein
VVGEASRIEAFDLVVRNPHPSSDSETDVTDLEIFVHVTGPEEGVTLWGVFTSDGSFDSLTRRWTLSSFAAGAEETLRIELDIDVDAEVSPPIRAFAQIESFMWASGEPGTSSIDNASPQHAFFELCKEASLSFTYDCTDDFRPIEDLAYDEYDISSLSDLIGSDVGIDSKSSSSSSSSTSSSSTSSSEDDGFVVRTCTGYLTNDGPSSATDIQVDLVATPPVGNARVAKWTAETKEEFLGGSARTRRWSIEELAAHATREFEVIFVVPSSLDASQAQLSANILSFNEQA